MNLHLGIPEDDEHRMQMFIDTGTTMNTGKLMYHIRVILQYPEIVDEFIQKKMDADYNVVYLLAPLDLNGVATDIDHVQMTT